MTRRRFIADRWDRSAATAELLGPQALHLGRVLRATPGQTFDLVAGGFLHRATVAAVSLTPDHERIAFTLHEELEADTALPLHLLLAIFKFDHLEWAIEKATELGVARITPILARRTEKHLALASAKRVDRWRRIALEATKQSRRTDTPALDDPTPLPTALAHLDPQVNTQTEPNTTRILLSEIEQATPLAAALHPLPPNTPIALAIGPEGGWTPEELTLFTTNAWQPVTLGPRILRAETAAVAATAITSSTLQSQTTAAPALPPDIPATQGSEQS